MSTPARDTPSVPAANLWRGDWGIRPLHRGDYDWVLDLWADSTNLMTYRFGGIPPNPERFLELLWSGVNAQFVIVRKDRPNNRYGLITLYNHDLRAQHCGLALVLDPQGRGSGWPIMGAGIALEHWFRITRCHKVWIELAEWNLQIASGLALFGFELEGVQRDHEWLDGRYWDRHLYALFRDRWDELRPERWGKLLPGADDASG